MTEDSRRTKSDPPYQIDQIYQPEGSHLSKSPINPAPSPGIPRKATEDNRRTESDPPIKLTTPINQRVPSALRIIASTTAAKSVILHFERLTDLWRLARLRSQAAASCGGRMFDSTTIDNIDKNNRVVTLY